MDRRRYVLLPWGVLALAFALNLIIFAAVPTPAGGTYSGSLLTIYVILFAVGVLSVARSLPFGLALGLSRRSYYLGTVLLVVGLGAVYGLALAVLQVIERGTAGWGLSLHLFRVPWILDGPWYLTWLTSFVVLVLMFVYGMWYGLVHRRWGIVGLATFAATQAVVLVAAALVITWAHVWPAIGGFFTTLSAAGLTGVLAAVAALLALGGFATMRRVTV